MGTGLTGMEHAVVSPLRAALSQELDGPWRYPLCIAFGRLTGWRNGAPDTRHPKSKSLVQKNGKSAKCWQPHRPTGKLKGPESECPMVFQDEGTAVASYWLR